MVEVSLGEIEVPAEAVVGDGDGAEFLRTNRGVMQARDFKQMGLDLPASFTPIFLGDELRKPFVASSDLGFGCHAMQRWNLLPLSSDWQFGFAKAGTFPANSRRVPEQGQDSARPSFLGRRVPNPPPRSGLFVPSTPATNRRGLGTLGVDGYAPNHRNVPRRRNMNSNTMGEW